MDISKTLAALPRRHRKAIKMIARAVTPQYEEDGDYKDAIVVWCEQFQLDISASSLPDNVIRIVADGLLTESHADMAPRSTRAWREQVYAGRF